MNIWDECVRALKEEKGAYLILIATILPLIFGFAGFAVDMGNYQAHSAKLQHAADSAALAGAVVYAANGETEDSHASADEAAEKYLKANLGSGEFNALVDTGNEIRYQVKTSGDVSYYRVYIKENLDTTFIRLIGAPFFTHPQGEAIATIPVSKGGGGGDSSEPDQVSFKNLISFDGEMFGSFNNDNRNQIHATFDGDVYCYNRWGPWDHYGHWEHWEGDWDRRYRFYTGQALNMSPWEADRLGYYKEMQGGDPRTYDTFTYETDKALKKLFDNEPTVVRLSGAQNYTLSGTNLKSDYYSVQSTGGNLTINLSNFSEEQDKPVYIYVEGNLELLKLSVQNDVKRPVVLCYSGVKPWGSYGGPGPTNVEIESQNRDFRGVIYTPYANNHVNFENSTFTGSIITHNLDLSSNHGKFVFEQFGIPSAGSGGSSGGGSGGSSSGVDVDLKLVPDPGLGWEE